MAETSKKNRYYGSYSAQGGNANVQVNANASGWGNANAAQMGAGNQQNAAGSFGNANMWQGGTGFGRGQSNSNVAITSDLMAQAELYYQAAYEAQRLAAQQTHDESQLLLDQQLAGLQATYDQQREQSRENYAQVYSQADRQALSRGMQRSSYTGSTLANINLAGNEAQQAINDTQAQQTGNLQEQKTLYGRQLQQTLESLTKQQQADILAKADELKKRQEELALQQQEIRLQEQQMAMEYHMWLQEFNAKYGDKGGGGSSSSGSSSSGGSKKTSSSASTSLLDLVGTSVVNPDKVAELDKVGQQAVADKKSDEEAKKKAAVENGVILPSIKTNYGITKIP